MNIGMDWRFESKNSPLEVEVRAAALYYDAKYNLVATECWVHPTVWRAAGEPAFIGAVSIRPSRTIAPGELWIGVGKTVDVGHAR